MKIAELINNIESKQGCEVIKRKQPIDISEYGLPEDLNYYLSNYKGIKLFADKPFGINIVSFEDFKATNKVLYPEGDAIWKELEGDISESWYMIAKAEEPAQYISIDLDEERKGYCYNIFLENHAVHGSSQIIAKSFTELLSMLLKSGGEKWFWTEEDFEGYGAACQNEPCQRNTITLYGVPAWDVKPNMAESIAGCPDKTSEIVTYKMTGLDHTILNRSKYGVLPDSEKEEIMCNLAENYFMSYKGLRSYDRWGRQTTTGLFEREGKEFVFVPGDKITIGWDAFAEGFDSFNYEDVQSILSECEYEGSVESYLREVMMPVKEVQVAPMLVCRNLQTVCWEPIPIDSPEIQGNKKLMSELNECEARGCDEYTVHEQIKFVRGNDGWSVFLYRPMSYPDLKEQLARQGFSLPTADEWAYLCGGGCRTIFPFGDNLDLDTMHLCYIGEPGDKRPYYMKEPNFFGLSIGYDPYMDELIDAKQKSNCGGDGGCNFCGGMGIVIPFLPCSPHYKPRSIYPEDNEELNGDYDFYRPIIRIK